MQVSPLVLLAILLMALHLAGPAQATEHGLHAFRFGVNETINLMAIAAVIWIALRTERLRRQTDDTGRFRRIHERVDEHGRRLAAHETRLQGLPTHKDLARIDARLIAVEQCMQQIAHSVTRMEDFLIHGVTQEITKSEGEANER